MDSGWVVRVGWRLGWPSLFSQFGLVVLVNGWIEVSEKRKYSETTFKFDEYKTSQDSKRGRIVPNT